MKLKAKYFAFIEFLYLAENEKKREENTRYDIKTHDMKIQEKSQTRAQFFKFSCIFT